MDPVGSGPYTLEKINDDNMILLKNNYYFKSLEKFSIQQLIMKKMISISQQNSIPQSLKL